MVKKNSRTLAGVALDWAVARAEKMQVFVDVNDDLVRVVREMGVDDEPVFRPSQDWAFAGEVLARERIVLMPTRTGGWFTSMWGVRDDEGHVREVGIDADDPLTAVLRCLVFSKLGDFVEIPDELADVDKGASWCSVLVPQIGRQSAAKGAASKATNLA